MRTRTLTLPERSEVRGVTAPLTITESERLIECGPTDRILAEPTFEATEEYFNGRGRVSAMAPSELQVVQELPPLTQGSLRVLRVGDIQLNLDGYSVQVAGQPSHIRMQEFKILRLLMANAGRVMTRQDILDRAWYPGFIDHHGVLTTHLVRVRRILNSGGYERLRTVRGIGYVVDAEPIEYRRG